MAFIMLGMCLIVVGCTNEQKVSMPEDVPDFVSVSDFESIDWNQKAVKFGDRGIIGNENKSGVIGADMPSLNGQKWMWHLWGNDDPVGKELTIVGFHKETNSVHPILMTGWSLQLGGENNGANAHAPSSVQIPEPGEWAILLYVDEKLFDTLIYDINE